MKTKLLTLLFLLSLLINQDGYSQKSDALQELYFQEYQTLKEFIEKNANYKGDTNINVGFYHLNIEIGIDYPYINGNVMIQFEPAISELNSVRFDLNSALQVDSISHPCQEYYQEGDEIYITLDQEYSSGDLLNLTIYFQGVPVLAGGYKGLRYETHDENEPIIATLSTPYLAHYWYPCKDGPEDKADSVYLDITIPDTVIQGNELIAISNGLLENTIVSGSKKTFEWRHRYPIVTYYVMAAISNYVHFQETYTGTGGESFPLDYYVFEEELAISQAGVEDMPEVMQFFSDIFGTYPFSDEKYGMTQLGYYGAIENQTNTITNNMSPSWFDVSVHELGHMWFGDMITCSNWHHGWLNEGFATYSEALWEEHKNGWAAYQNNMSANQYWNGGTLYLENALDTFNVFQPIIYYKGAYVLHMLRGILGDEVFFDAVLDYSQNPDYTYKNATTEDLQETFEIVSGLNLDYFFEQWIYDEYYPFYHYNYEQTSENILYITLYQAQEEIYGYRPVFKMPVQLSFSFLNGTDTSVTVWNDQQTQQYSFIFPDEVVEMELDPDKWILRKEVYNPNIPVGFENTKNDNPIEVYPNPFMDKIYIEIPNNYNGENILLSLFTANGVLVKEETVMEGVFNTRNLPSGSYYYVIKNSGIKITSGKLIKVGK